MCAVYIIANTPAVAGGTPVDRLVGQGRGDGHFTTAGAGHALLLMTTGVITAVPLICFGAAAIRIPMTTLGLLQYLAPVLQFLLGVAVLGERMSPMRWVGFALVWVGWRSSRSRPCDTGSGSWLWPSRPAPFGASAT